jgi:hypothetical protein
MGSWARNLVCGAAMTSGMLLALWARVEPWIAIVLGAAVVIVGADVLFTERPERVRPSFDAPLAVRTERRLLMVLLGLAVLVRVVGWESAWTPAWWFSEVMILPVDKMLHDGTLWATWMRQLAATRINVAYEATTVLPLLAGLQTLLGPRFGLSVLAGALLGSIAVLLAWALGRQMRSPVFGLVFGAFVAFSPMQLMWSRLSAMCTESVVHALLALFVGYLAGRRGSFWLAIVTGVIAWTSVQQYYAARASLPLAVVGIVAGGQRSWRLGRSLALVLAAGLAFGTVHRAVHGDAFTQSLWSLWPSYQGYVGNKGERSLVDLVEQNRDAVLNESRKTLDFFFLKRRTSWESDARLGGLENGGLCLAPVAVLGGLGFFAVLRRFRRQWPWLAVAVIGFAMPALSTTSARRMLLFDLAWCGFAAHGLLAVVDGLGRRFSYGAQVRIAIGIMITLALSATFAVFGLSAVMPGTYGKHIPFGDAGFGDGIACKRCLEAAQGWQRDIAAGAFVVLFDNDAYRENATSPGGLPSYGKIASLAAGLPGRFVEAYALMSNFDPFLGRAFEPSSTFTQELAARIERASPRRIIWHFERPTPWERTLANRLQTAGGEFETFDTPLSPYGGIRVTTPWEQRAAALALVDELTASVESQGGSCFELIERKASRFLEGPVFVLATADPGVEEPPEWLATSGNQHRLGPHSFATPTEPIGAHLVSPAGASQRLELIDSSGKVNRTEVSSLQHEDVPSGLPPPGTRYGMSCAAYVAGHWWAIEPMTGRVVSSHPAARAVPDEPWIGIAAGPSDELVLASAEQSILIFDPGGGEVIRSFPGRVPPTVREWGDECTPVVVGTDWIGIANLRTTLLSLYTLTGRDLGTQRLDRVVSPGMGISTIGGAGRYLAIPSTGSVRTFEVRMDPACTTTAADGS